MESKYRGYCEAMSIIDDASLLWRRNNGRKNIFFVKACYSNGGRLGTLNCEFGVRSCEVSYKIARIQEAMCGFLFSNKSTHNNLHIDRVRVLLLKHFVN